MSLLIPKYLSMPIPIPTINSQFVIPSTLIPMFFFNQTRQNAVVNLEIRLEVSVFPVMYWMLYSL